MRRGEKSQPADVRGWIKIRAKFPAVVEEPEDAVFPLTKYLISPIEYSPSFCYPLKVTVRKGRVTF